MFNSHYANISVKLVNISVIKLYVCVRGVYMCANVFISILSDCFCVQSWSCFYSMLGGLTNKTAYGHNVLKKTQISDETVRAFAL